MSRAWTLRLLGNNGGGVDYDLVSNATNASDWIANRPHAGFNEVVHPAALAHSTTGRSGS
jgi:hypothetical protein